MGPPKTSRLVPLEQLPRTSASDVKRRGWRSIVNTLRSNGKLVVTNHDQPEAVILPVEEYDALMQIAEHSQIQADSILAGLRDSFDARLAVLNRDSAAKRLRGSIRGRNKLAGKVKAGSGY